MTTSTSSIDTANRLLAGQNRVESCVVVGDDRAHTVAASVAIAQPQHDHVPDLQNGDAQRWAM